MFNSQKFYSLKKILSKQATYNIVIGERSNGKSYAVLYYGLEQFISTGGQLAVVRRWREDITGRRASQMMEGLNDTGAVHKLCKKYGRYKDDGTPLYDGIVYYAGKWYLCQYDDGKPIYNRDTDCFAFAFALSSSEHDKSLSYPKVTTILFDEFLTNTIYLQDEFVLFLNVVSTIVRRRLDVKIFLLGNTVNKYCPYFTEMGLTNVSKMVQGSIDVYKYGDSGLSVAVEYCSPIKKSNENNFYFAFNNPKLQMITNGAWEIAIYPHCPCKYKPKNILLTYFILFQDEVFQCEIINVGKDLFTYIHRKTTPLRNPDTDIIYTLDYNPQMNYNRNILKPTNNLQKKILWFYKLDKVYYQDNDVGDSIANYIKICKQSL